MGVLQRFERRLEGLVEGAFARVFGGVVQPVEVAAALQREAADKKQIVGQRRVLVPNSFVVELGPTDLERFGEWDGPLRAELAGMVEEHARDQGWSFVGDVEVAFERHEDIDTGVFRVRSAVSAPQKAPEPAYAAPSPPAPSYGTVTGRVPEQAPASRARLVVQGTGGQPDRDVPLGPVTRLGRSADADLRLSDTGVSRVHAEVRLDGGVATVADRGSTNGTSVNGRRVSTAVLHDGDVIELGASTLVFRAPDSER